MKRLLENPYVSPLLFALYPVVGLYAQNVPLVSMLDTGVPFALTIAMTATVFAALRGLRVESVRASILTSVWGVVFFSLGFGGHVFSAVVKNHGRELMILGMGAACGLLALTAWAALSVRVNLKPVLIWLNLTSALALLFPLTVIASSTWPTTRRQATEHAAADIVPQCPRTVDLPRGLPDIYYIVMDGFGSAETLQRLYGYDLGPFLRALEARGFDVARSSHSNYAQTYLSIASSLNMCHLLQVAECSERGPEFRRVLMGMIGHSEVLSVLSSRGYHTIAYGSGYTGTSRLSSDEAPRPVTYLSEFGTEFFRLTPIGYMGFIGLRDPLIMMHASRVRFAFDDLPRASERTNRPVFVFAHILMPHPPFVLDRDGRVTQTYDQILRLADGNTYPRGRGAYREGYREQVAYATKALDTMTNAILSRSDRQAIIILQGDHGPGMNLSHRDLEKTDLKERFGILNAYRIPAEWRLKPWPSITPVNSFRLVLNALFDMKLPYERDDSYYATWAKPHELIDVTKRLRSPLSAPRRSATHASTTHGDTGPLASP